MDSINSSNAFLQSIINLLQEKAERNSPVLSLDMFDTLVYRTVQKPKDLFFLTGELLQKQNAITINSYVFAKYREEAEKKAREDALRERGTTEVSLRDIYQQLSLKKYINLELKSSNRY